LPAAGPGATLPAIIFPWPRPFLASQNNRRLRPSAPLRPQGCPGRAAGRSSCHRGRLTAPRQHGDRNHGDDRHFHRERRAAHGEDPDPLHQYLAGVRTQREPVQLGRTDLPRVRRTECGAAWEKTSGAGRTYYSVRLDDPTFMAPVFASLVAQGEGGYALIWSRSQQRRECRGRRRASPAASQRYSSVPLIWLARGPSYGDLGLVEAGDKLVAKNILANIG
jgi:Protein of unknown function (DUF736)